MNLTHAQRTLTQFRHKNAERAASRAIEDCPCESRRDEAGGYLTAAGQREWDSAYDDYVWRFDDAVALWNATPGDTDDKINALHGLVEDGLVEDVAEAVAAGRGGL